MITFKKGTYKIVGYFSNDKNNIVIKSIDGLLFTYQDREFGMSKKTYNNKGEEIEAIDYIITDIETGMKIDLYAKNKNAVEELFEQRLNLIESIKQASQNEKLKDIKQRLTKSNLGKLFNI